jgi:Pyridine nucleotide-disulphide oxidoreductase, dimerisation domain
MASAPGTGPESAPGTGPESAPGTGPASARPGRMEAPKPPPTSTLIKLVAERESLWLLGAHILAPDRADAIQTAAIAIRHSLTVGDRGGTLFAYLTTVEGIKPAALGCEKDVVKLSCCAG